MAATDLLGLKQPIFSMSTDNEKTNNLFKITYENKLCICWNIRNFKSEDSFFKNSFKNFTGEFFVNIQLGAWMIN